MPDPTIPAQDGAATGAVERLVRDDVGRKRFLKLAGAGAAASFGAFVLAACGSSGDDAATTAAPTSTSAMRSGGHARDVAILNYALTLEYLETEFYEQVVAAQLFTGATGELVASFGRQEQQHVDAIRGTVAKLGGTPAAKPAGRFPIENAKQVALLAYTVENLGAAAYLGQAARIQSDEVLAAALAIHSVEARHAATLGTLVRKPVTPNGAFAKPADMRTVLAAVRPFLAA